LSAGAGNGKGWSKGLTAPTDARVARAAQANRGQRRGPYRKRDGVAAGDCPVLPIAQNNYGAYGYLLGMYLGDGYLATCARTLDLRVFLDSSQPSVIESCEEAMRRVNPFHPIGKVIRPPSVTIVRAYGRCWLSLFPQHGPGKKHTRLIALEPWQTNIVTAEPFSFLAGLLHSDGSRFVRTVGGKAYPAYNFFNHSTDILDLFCWACDLAGVHYTRPGRHQVSIARRADVAVLDSRIGPKN